MKKILWSLIVPFAVAAAAVAQDASPSPSPDQRQQRQPTWEADMPGGTFIVRLSAILEISTHEYVVDGAARVTEANVCTSGTGYVRFYYIEPNVPQAPDGIGQSSIDALKDRMQDASTRVGADDAWRKVVKNYPTTTHAHTIEYRLPTKDSVYKLFDSVKTAWLVTWKTTIFKP